MFDELLLIADADACHLNWGDTTLYSLYSMSTNKNLVLLAYGLQAGNECKRTWSAFFAYCKKIYPHLDTLKKTLIFDQDKGLVAAFQQTFNHSAHFCCSTHQGKNIQANHNKMVREQWEIARKASTALLLSAAKEGFSDFSPNAKNYLNSLPDEEKYPIARLDICCAARGPVGLE